MLLLRGLCIVFFFLNDIIFSMSVYTSVDSVCSILVCIWVKLFTGSFDILRLRLFVTIIKLNSGVEGLKKVPYACVPLL